MKECITTEKHDTCQHKCWNGDESKKLCLSRFPIIEQPCPYVADFIHFKDIEDNTIMYPGNIESSGEFNTKAEWIKELGHDDLRAEYGDEWHTATVRTVTIDINNLLERAEEDEETYDGWYLEVRSAGEDPVVKAGFERLNEILSGYPIYTEDLRVIFD